MGDISPGLDNAPNTEVVAQAVSDERLLLETQAACMTLLIHHTVTCKTVTMFGTFLVYTLLCLYAWKSHFMLVGDIGESTPGYT
jgi:hypothetical protein